MVDAAEIRRYLEVLFAKATSGWMAVQFQRPGEPVPRSHFAPAGAEGVERLVNLVAQKAIHDNAWARISLLRHRPEQGRGKEEDSVALLGLALDIDYGTVGHRKANLPPDERAAWQVLEAVMQRLGGAGPTMVVHSGHGLQPY